ncbi:unnamed protein product [Mycena citricolor]|uniref:F-box domain-containing protein n=1 Tax=Mycena citricolor TaxID=2018698 RepID=A0AAD2HXT6_9AGAR|nr:unnamed protein product [Mycena citricolor]
MADQVTAFSEPGVVEKAQQELDQHIRHHFAQISALQTRRNALAPISRLPPEVLSRVFLCLVLSDSYSVRWTREISHVCRQWRAVALEFPWVWSYPSFRHLDWAEEMLERSKSALLTIKFHEVYTPPRMIDLLTRALSQVSRLGELDFDVKDRLAQLGLLVNMTDPAPFLHTLHLEATGHYGGPLSLPATFLGGDTPRLRRVDLTGFAIAWDSPLLRNLTRLRVVHFARQESTLSMTMKELLDALDHMPLLESLELKNILPPIAVQARPRVLLAHLESLELADNVEECCGILSQMTYPSSAKVHVACFGEKASSCHPIFSACNIAGRSPRSLEIGMTHSRVIVRLWMRTVDFQGTAFRDSALEISASWRLPSNDGNESTFLLICQTLPLNNLRALSFLSDSHGISTAAWIASTVPNLPKLRAIKVVGSPVGFLKSLGEDVVVSGVKQTPAIAAVVRKSVERRVSRRNQAGAAAVTGGLFFPALRHLCLCGMNFEEATLEQFGEAIMERCHWNQELFSLTLQRCEHLTEEDVRGLKEIVSSVEWDGLEIGFTDSEEEEEEEYNADYDYGDYHHYMFDNYYDDYDSDFDYM